MQETMNTTFGIGQGGTYLVSIGGRGRLEVAIVIFEAIVRPVAVVERELPGIRCGIARVLQIRGATVHLDNELRISVHFSLIVSTTIKDT